ncbi:MAG: radical SAM protein [Desulfobacterales bacterium]
MNMPTLPMGLGCVAAATQKAGHDVAFVDLLSAVDIGPLIKKTIHEFAPRVIGISARNIDDQVMQSPRFMLDQAKEVAALCRKLSKAPLVLGGAGYSMFPHSALEYVDADMGIQGEGEVAFPALLKHIEQQSDPGEVPGLYLRGRGLQAKRTYVKDLDSLPFPEPSLLLTANSDTANCWLPFQTRRGCPLDCSYCSTATIEGHRIRQRSPAAAVRELYRWVDAGLNQLFFVDNTFNLPKSYAMELCKRLAAAALGIGWRCIVYPRKISEDLVKTMARAGCSEVSLGFESGNNDILRAMNNRFDVGEIRQANQIFADYGIRRMGFLMLGGPGETRQSVEQSFDFVESLELDALKITLGIRIYPYTDLAKTAIEEGMIASDDDLLFPKFYIDRDLNEWLEGYVKDRRKNRPNWFL